MRVCIGKNGGRKEKDIKALCHRKSLTLADNFLNVH